MISGEGTENSARKESKVHPFVNGREPPHSRPPPSSLWIQGRWVWGSGRVSALPQARPLGALFGPGSEIDSSGFQGRGQQVLLSLPRLL